MDKQQQEIYKALKKFVEDEVHEGDFDQGQGIEGTMSTLNKWWNENKDKYKDQTERFPPSARNLESEAISKTHGCTIGDLIRTIEKYNLPMDGKVLVERVHDYYYVNNNWATYLKGRKHPCGDSIVEYSPVWSPVKFSDEDTHLFIDLHY